MLPQQTERNVRVSGEEDGCGESFRVTLADVARHFFKGRERQPVELIKKKRCPKKKKKEKEKVDKPAMFSISLNSKIKTVQHCEVQFLCSCSRFLHVSK